MSDSEGNGKVSRKPSKNKGEKVKFFDWLFHGKGTVSEPWPTAKELLDSSEEEIKKLREAFNTTTEK